MKDLAEQIRRGTGAQKAILGARIQSLWGGYGELRRVELVGSRAANAIVKIVSPPAERELGRDAQKLRSHRRKLRSYAVELAFYRRYAERCDVACRVPALLHGAEGDGQFLFVLEDLDEAGFPGRRGQCTDHEIAVGLAWLAAFHARFLGVQPEKLWRVGSYWHLATRPDELAVLGASELARAAARIDERLNAARFQTFVHGDAKLENFCFSPTGRAVAVVDFQYVGGGIGMKDVAYYLGSCLHAADCESEIPGHLEQYFEALRAELARCQPSCDALELEREWRSLFAWAWVDFQRFLLGWAPSYAAGDRYSERLTREILSELA